ncbi:unnamed protein product [Caenorhabditis auriculariae]|uniref:Mediator complex subunit 24 n=1 Tax=Caenorhabditis auriculariae TaxID=2777116 RepID=A0A8S1HAE9_9PELO|nr:unnamed protein product [Caenorhabditis auriculariae]
MKVDDFGKKLTSEQQIIQQMWAASTLSTDIALKLLREHSCNLVSLSNELIKAATMTEQFEERFTDFIIILVKTEKISWATVLRSVCLFQDYRKYECMNGACRLVEFALINLQCPSLEDTKYASDLCSAIGDVFAWLLNAILEIGEMRNSKHDIPDALNRPFAATLRILKDSLTSQFLRRYKYHSELVQLVRTTVEAMDRFEARNDEDILKIMQATLKRHFEAICKPIQVFDQKNECCDRYKQTRTCVRTLTSVFACYRILSSVDEVADAFHAFATINGMTFAEVVFDMVHATLLIQAEEHEKPQKRMEVRVTFRWHVAVFYYLKLSKIWNSMVKRYKHAVKEISVAIERVLNTLRMTLDLVDAAWKDCSFRSLLMNLVKEGLMEQKIADKFIETRLKQMQQNGEVTIYSRRDPNQAQKNDISMLNSALGAAFSMTSSMSFEKLSIIVQQGMMGASGFTFEAICATCCVEGNLADFSSRLAQLNFKCQASSTKFTDSTKAFDNTFLLLTRISLNFPTLNLKQLVNGRTAPIAIDEQSIFYKWAYRYLKRVRKLRKKLENTENYDVAEASTSQKNPVKTEPVTAIDEKLAGSSIGGICLSPMMRSNTIEPHEDDDENILPKIPREEAAAILLKLKDRQPFWSDKPEIPQLIFSIPMIGAILLEEYQNKHLDKQRALTAMKNIIYGLQELSSLFVCLIQYLDCQQDSVARRALGATIHQALDNILDETHDNGEEALKWPFILSMLKPIIVEMSEKPPVYPDLAITSFTIARRFCPHLHRAEVPDLAHLKKAWIYSQRQAWASPHVLRMLEHCNLAGQHKDWISFFVTYMMKLKCGEMMVKAVDMISAFMMMDQLGSLIRMLEMMVDYMFEDGSLCDIRFEQPFVAPLIRLLTQVLFVAVWTLECEKKKLESNEPKSKRAKLQLELSEGEQDTPEALVHLLDESINVAMNKFLKKLKEGVLSSVVCAIFHLMRSIAASPNSEPKRLLLQRIPPKLIFELAYIEAFSVPIEMFETFCQAGNPEHDAERLRYLCVLKRRGIL